MIHYVARDCFVNYYRYYYCADLVFCLFTHLLSKPVPSYRSRSIPLPIYSFSERFIYGGTKVAKKTTAKIFGFEEIVKRDHSDFNPKLC